MTLMFVRISGYNVAPSAIQHPLICSVTRETWIAWFLSHVTLSV